MAIPQYEASKQATNIIEAALQNGNMKLVGSNSSAIADPGTAAQHDAKYLTTLYIALVKEIQKAGD